jgi:hypothetical protein
MSRTFALTLLTVALVAMASVQSFSVAPLMSFGAVNGGSSFVQSARLSQVPVVVQTKTNSNGLQMMGGKQSKFGVFSPAVYGAKFALGEKKLNTIRGKAISLHSKYIGEFCQWAGAYHLRTRLIKKAKVNGDVLGFLV